MLSGCCKPNPDALGWDDYYQKDQELLFGIRFKANGVK